MNLLIILSFIVFVAAILVAMYPRKSALMLVGVNKHDLTTVPGKLVAFVFLLSLLVMTAALVVLLQEVSVIQLELPNWFENFDWALWS